MFGYYATNDGGETWSYVNDSSVSNLNRFIPAGRGAYFASGNGVYKVMDTTYTMVKDQPPLHKPNILKIHPNPTSGKFTLEIDLGVSTRGHIVVYNVAGQVLTKIDHQPWTKGQHLQQFDSSQYPAGTYYVGFITDHGNWFAPVVVSR